MIERRQQARRDNERRHSVAQDRLITMLWDTIWDLQLLQQKAQEALGEADLHEAIEKTLQRTIEHARAAELQAMQDLEAITKTIERSAAQRAGERRAGDRRVNPDRRQAVEVGSMVQP